MLQTMSSKWFTVAEELELQRWINARIRKQREMEKKKKDEEEAAEKKKREDEEFDEQRRLQNLRSLFNQRPQPWHNWPRH